MGTPKNQDKVPHQGRQSGKSSASWFTSSTAPLGTRHPKGNGASAGNGKTSDTSILGKIAVVFKKGNR